MKKIATFVLAAAIGGIMITPVLAGGNGYRDALADKVEACFKRHGIFSPRPGVDGCYVTAKYRAWCSVPEKEVVEGCKKEAKKALQPQRRSASRNDDAAPPRRRR